MFELKAQMYFAAAHHLLNYEGECENQHGHNWLVEAYVKGNNLDKSNILVDYKVLKREMKAVLDLLDHKDLNELSYFNGESPSSEMISMFIYNQLKERIPLVSKISVFCFINTPPIDMISCTHEDPRQKSDFSYELHTTR